MSDNNQDLSFILNELGEERELYFRAIAPPIMQTSNFAFRKVEELSRVFEDEYSAYLYSRGLNPTIDILRTKLAALDGAEDCLVFNSGASAIFASVFANVQSGDHIVSVNKPYTWAQRMFDNVLPKFNVVTTYVDGRNIENFERAILPNTRVIYLESPNSWDFALQDLRAVAELARAENIVTICDNSYCTPLFQKPISLGIDLVLQSASKYIGGHSDVVAGVLTGTRSMMKRIFDNELLNMGIGISPFNAWLLIRGLRTLSARLERISKTTVKVIEFLKQHQLVEDRRLWAVYHSNEGKYARRNCNILRIVASYFDCRELGWIRKPCHSPLCFHSTGRFQCRRPGTPHDQDICWTGRCRLPHSRPGAGLRSSRAAVNC